MFKEQVLNIYMKFLKNKIQIKNEKLKLKLKKNHLINLQNLDFLVQLSSEIIYLFCKLIFLFFQNF